MGPIGKEVEARVKAKIKNFEDSIDSKLKGSTGSENVLKFQGIHGVAGHFGVCGSQGTTGIQGRSRY